MKMRARDRVYIEGLALAFFNALTEKDLHDHPEMFECFDNVLRARGYQISCLQLGIYGTRLCIERIPDAY